LRGIIFESFQCTLEEIIAHFDQSLQAEVNHIIEVNHTTEEPVHDLVIEERTIEVLDSYPTSVGLNVTIRADIRKAIQTVRAPAPNVDPNLTEITRLLSNQSSQKRKCFSLQVYLITQPLRRQQSEAF